MGSYQKPSEPLVIPVVVVQCGFSAPASSQQCSPQRGCNYGGVIRHELQWWNPDLRLKANDKKKSLW